MHLIAAVGVNVEDAGTTIGSCRTEAIFDVTNGDRVNHGAVIQRVVDIDEAILLAPSEPLAVVVIIDRDTSTSKVPNTAGLFAGGDVNTDGRDVADLTEINDDFLVLIAISKDETLFAIAPNVLEISVRFCLPLQSGCGTHVRRADQVENGVIRSSSEDRGVRSDASTVAVKSKVGASVAASTDHPVLSHVVENSGVHVATTDRIGNELRDLLELVVDHDRVVLDSLSPLVSLFNFEEF